MSMDHRRICCPCGKCFGIDYFWITPPKTEYGYDGKTQIHKFRIEGEFYITERGSIYCASCNSLVYSKVKI
jgi:hypothetical protein